MTKKVKRLYQSFHPKHYEISLTIAEDKETFSGSVVIVGTKTGRPSSRFMLHQKNLKISNVTISHRDKKSVTTDVTVSRVNRHSSYDELRIHTERPQYSGEYTLSMDFSGIITKNMDGIYPCFFEENGQKKRLIATQFESHHAREVFPCIDEPEAKATFQLTLTHAKGEIALSNTPIIEEESSANTTTTVFDVTPIMSTYLVAFVAGELRYQEAISKNGVQIRTYAVPSQAINTKFALESAVKAMDFYEEYYDIPYPLKKCDFIALPDFASGAMENWGLITFREQGLLCDKNTSLHGKQYVALVVAHELTHQWFGNLVTMRWWTDLWLNEGFASWMEYLAVDALYPEWHFWTHFSVDEQQTALKADSLEHTHPIEVPVKHPDEIRTIFDIISYQKGASMIHMLHDYLGADNFRDGLRHYLKKHAYKNTDTVDLWQALEDVTKKPVKEFMGAWTSQSGFPLLAVKKEKDHLTITQSKFVTNPASLSRNDATLWPVPLLTKGLGKSTITKRTTNVPIIGGEATVKLNIGQTGFYRVNYSHDMQQSQLDALDNGQLDEQDRMGLLSDSFEVTKAGYQSVTEYLDLLAHFSDENSLPVWEVIAGSIGSIRHTLSKSDEDGTLRDAMKPFVIRLVSKQLKRLGWKQQPNESHLDILLRPLIIGLAASSDEESTIKKCQSLYKEMIEKNTTIHPDLRNSVYGTIARIGGETEYAQLLDMYKNSRSSDEKLSITSALTNFEQPEINDKVLQLITSDTVRLQDISYWIAYSFMNRHSRKATWKWLQNNWGWLKESVGTDLSFARTPVYAARTFHDKEQIDEFIEFFSSRMEPMLERSYNQGLEIAQTSAAWRQRDSQAALDWFIKT